MKFVAVPVLLLLLAANATSQDVAKETKTLDGTWLPATAELGGTAFDEKLLSVMKLEMKGDKYTVTVGGKVDKGTVKLDLSKNPKAMDIMGDDGPNKGKTFLAIYELNGDTLKVCYDLLGKERPTEFKTQKGELRYLVTYKRAK